MKSILLLLGIAASLFAQDKGGAPQQATNCSQNFGPQSSNNTGSIICYGVDKKLAAQLSEVVAASKRDSQTLKDLLDRIGAVLKDIQNSQPATTIIQQAPNGINIGPGAIAPNPQVNNFGPIPANITWTEDVTTQLPESGGGEKVITVHLKTDRSIPGAIIALILSGPVTMTQEYWNTHNPTLKPSGAFEVDIIAQLSSGGTGIPNSMGLKVVLPSAFTPDQDLAVVLTSKVDVHVKEAADITSKFR